MERVQMTREEPLDTENIGYMPKSLGPYRLLRLLGRGGMSEVFLATRYGASGFAKEFALKTLPFSQSMDEHLTRSLIEEARLGAQLSHRNLVQIYDLGVEQGMYYLCMEYVAGCDLKRSLQRGPFPVSFALMIASEIALALDYMHRACDRDGRKMGLIHRDISPSNILLSHEGEVKLADFGLMKATKLSDVTWGRFRKGTMAYMSPEQITGETLSPQSDQFGLGVVLYECLTGRRPFEAEAPAELLKKITSDDEPVLEGVSEDVRALLAQMLRKVPSERVSCMREVYMRLRALQQRDGVACVYDFADYVRGS